MKVKGDTVATTTSVIPPTVQANSAACNENVLTTQVKQSMEANLSPTQSGQFSQAKRISISSSDSNISCLLRATLEGMWNEAEGYLQSSVNVVATPGGTPNLKWLRHVLDHFHTWFR